MAKIRYEHDGYARNNGNVRQNMRERMMGKAPDYGDEYDNAQRDGQAPFVRENAGYIEDRPTDEYDGSLNSYFKAKDRMKQKQQNRHKR